MRKSVHQRGTCIRLRLVHVLPLQKEENMDHEDSPGSSTAYRQCLSYPDVRTRISCLDVGATPALRDSGTIPNTHPCASACQRLSETLKECAGTDKDQVLSRRRIRRSGRASALSRDNLRDENLRPWEDAGDTGETGSGSVLRNVRNDPRAVGQRPRRTFILD